MLTNKIFNNHCSDCVQFVVSYVLTEKLEKDSFAQVVLSTEGVIDIAEEKVPVCSGACLSCAE